MHLAAPRPEPHEIRIKKLHPDAILPSYAHGPDEDAAMDLRALERTVLTPAPRKPSHWHRHRTSPRTRSQVRPRSGLALKHSITVDFGTIDPVTAARSA